MKRYFPLLVILAFSCSPKPEGGKQVRIKTNHSVITDYWLYLPENYSVDQSYPIILFLQGGLGNSADPRASRNDGPVKYALRESLKSAELSQYVKDSFIIINPHMTAGIAEQRQWFQYSDVLAQIVEQVQIQFNGDIHRTYLTGLSKGASGGLGLLEQYSDLFKAAVLICGRYSTSNLDRIKDKPLWLIHNEQDPQVSIEYTSDVIESFEQMEVQFEENSAFQASPAKRQFTILPLEGHDAWNYTYAQPQIYRWLLSHE